MKNLKKLQLLAICLLVLAGSVYSDRPQPEKVYFAVEQNGIRCGFSESIISNVEIDGREAILLNERIEMKITALGAEVETKLRFKSHVDPETGQYFYFEYEVDQGSVNISAQIEIDGDIARIKSQPDGKIKEISLPPDVVLENNLYTSRLVKEFVEGGLEEKSYKTLDLNHEAVHDVTYYKIGEEQLELDVGTFNTIILKKLDHETGTKMTWWFNIENGDAIKGVLPTRTIYLSDSTVMKDISRVSVDDDLFAKVDVAISDIKAISYMKAKATLEPGGEWITTESLNIPGQKFEGTVKENLIEGVFEISHKHYDGEGAPPFPADYSNDESLREYLEPQDMIESDDPVLIEKAKEITEGSKDSWEALKRLSRWVSEEIGYDIPGGGTAKRTFELQLGECGSHSRLLAAFCRGVGIPCRVVWGCMYTPDYGGAFGQHGWNEVYMGEAGWIPIDATAQELDYADSGHIRLGKLTGKSAYLNPKKMEILDYQAGSVTMANAGTASAPEEYDMYIGEYQGPNSIFKILVQNGSLAVDIPGKMIFELKEPNDEGVWIFKLTDAAGISFREDEAGSVVEMTLNSQTKLPRKVDTGVAEDAAAAPDEFQAYLGQYSVPMQNMALTVIVQDGNLAVDDPNEGIIGLTGPDDKMRWTDQFDKNKISFALDGTGKATAMIFHQIIKLPRIE
jgi:transglutaminase-like putative cysteine protease